MRPERGRSEFQSYCMNVETYNYLTLLLSLFPPGSDSGSEDSSEGFAPAGAGSPSSSRSQHEDSLPGLASLLPGDEDAGRHVSSPRVPPLEGSGQYEDVPLFPSVHDYGRILLHIFPKFWRLQIIKPPFRESTFLINVF